MLNSRLMGAVALTFTTALTMGVTIGTGAQAQNGVPAEFPPESYTANQYIDSDGCAFIRAGVSGNTQWVPRVARDRNQLCGFQPSLAAGPAPAPAPAPEPEVASVAAPPAATPTTTAPAPVAAAPRPTGNVGAPIATVAGITTPPAIRAPASSPAIVPMPAAVPAATPPAASPAPAPTITRAEACEGRFGIQPTFISDRTGQPIDCGARPASLPAVVPASMTLADLPAPTMTRAEACEGRYGVQRNFISDRTGQPIDCGPRAGVATIMAADVRYPQVTGPYTTPMLAGGMGSAPARVDPYPGIRRATLAELCVEISTTGARFVNVVTGQRVTCEGVPVVMATAPGPVAPGAPSAVGGPSAPGLIAPPATALAQGAVRPAATRAFPRPTYSLQDLISPQPVPASNPVAPYTQHVRPPAGYERVWDDGRINLQRGVPQPVSGQVVQSRTLSRTPVAAPTAPAAVPAAAPVAAAANRFIQIGTYGDPANADAAAARLRSLGLPVGFATSNRNGQQLRVVAAGPFASAQQLDDAMRAVRSAGYRDAFARN